MSELMQLKLDKIKVGANVRGKGSYGDMDGLKASIAQAGVLAPVIVRKVTNGTYDLVAGFRRVMAAKDLDLPTIPAIVHELTDEGAAEVQLIENLQREGLHPLDEAKGFAALARKPHSLTAVQIGERVGRSHKYVYDVMKLTCLIPKAEQLLRDGTILFGHAVELSRIPAKDQNEVCKTGSIALFSPEDTLPIPGQRYEGTGYKVRTVRELRAWIDQHVRFVDKTADPVLFVGTLATVKAAKEAKERVIPITHNFQVNPSARDGKRVFGPRSWKRVTGKPCAYAATGIVVVGPERGMAFKVCTSKKSCSKHYGAEIKAAEKRAKGEATKGVTGAAAAKQRRDKEQEKWQKQRAAEELLRARWKKASPSIWKAVAEALEKAPANGASAIAEHVLRHCAWNTKVPKPPKGATAEDVLRLACMYVLKRSMDEWRGPELFPKIARAWGVDVPKIMAEAAPVEKDKPKEPRPAKGKKPAGKKAPTKKPTEDEAPAANEDDHGDAEGDE